MNNLEKKDGDTRHPEGKPGEPEWHLIEGLREYGIFLLDADGVVLSWNAGAEVITGYPPAEVVGRPVSVLWKSVEEGELVGVLEQARTMGSARREGWLMRRGGEEYHADETFSVISPEADGGEGAFVVVLRDETERWREAEALRLSRVTFAGILEIASEAVVSVNESQRITFFNHGAEAMFGYAPDEVLGEPLAMLIPAAVRDAHGQRVRDFGDSGVTARHMGDRGEITGMRKSGESFPAEASISSLVVGDTRVYTAVMRDVSERRRIEDAVKANSLELARSNAELEQFAYVASHDLQEPLRMVASYTRLLARRYEGRLDADADEFIGYAVDGVNRMQELINDLLAYSRAGSRRREPADVPMDEVLARALKDLGPAIEEAGATVASSPLPVVWGDAGQLAQLLRNLIANAIKFRGKKAPCVEISARRDGDDWVFSVSDNGIGIAPEFSERIFVIFQRLHSRAEYPGTGIGLSICRKIVERHGGRIWVASEPGEGARFCFSLPVDRERGS
ncbi:MAG: PAS domain S-box protein [Gemmatimonadota bacterium]|jgi:PAS domain S-box-containing protein|nr:PAS domain S-box protein [Gemmatimonadota bacterium]